jgi:hypothetical protein
MSKSSTSGGIGFCGLLAIVFITLKLCGVINWSWLWVLCPLWIGLAILGVFLLILLFGVICVGLGLLVAWLFTKKK